MAALISWLSGGVGGRTLSGSVPARVPARQKTSLPTLASSSPLKKPTKLSSSKALLRKSRTAPSGNNSFKSTIRNTAATSNHFLCPLMAASSASLRRSPLARTNTPKTSPMPPPAGSFNPLRFRLQLSRSRCRVPHLLLDFPCAVPFTVQHQRHFSVALDRWLSIRRLHHLMLRRPFRC